MISVILPCYNVGEYVERCLNSIINNTYRNLEIICVIDGATDNTLEVVKSVKDDRVRIIEQENQGVSVARNVGIEAANGEFICFIDPDDWVSRDYFSELLICQQKTGAEIVGGSVKIVYDFKNREHDNIQSVICGKLYEMWNYDIVRTCIWGRLHVAEILKDIRFIRGMRVSEDKMFNIHILQRYPNLKVAVINTPLYY